MIDSGRLKRLLLVAAVLCLTGCAAALLAGAPSLAGGFGLGFVLGALPFASWGWIVSRGFNTGRARLLVVVLLATKLAIYSGTLYLFVTRPLVHPIGVLIGITAVVATISIGSLLAPGPAKEAA
jgi:hypothetical protein